MSPRKNTTVQELKTVIERRLARLVSQNPLNADFQVRYEEIIDSYNQEKDRVTIEKTFEALMRFVEELDVEEERHLREGLDPESLVIFDLLMKPESSPQEIAKIKAVAVALLAMLKREKLRVAQWREKEATRDAVQRLIYDFLYSDITGLPDRYAPTEIEAKVEAVFRHVYYAYPTVPSPFFACA